MLRCRVCFEEKPEASFSYKNKTLALRHTQCKDCNKTYCAAHYRPNAKQYKERAVVNSAVRREELHRRLFAYLAEHPCVDCGEADPLVLELDHRDGADKLTICRVCGTTDTHGGRSRLKSPSVMFTVQIVTVGGLHISKIGRMYFGIH